MSEISPGNIPSGYLSSEQTCHLLGISGNTLREWASRDRIKFWRSGGKGTHRRYDVREFILRNSPGPNESMQESTKPRKSICYARVSTRSQKDDLQRQIEFMRERYPTHEFISDVGSGINYKRKGLRTILEYASKGELQELVVAHKDRLCRFGFDLLEHIIQLTSRAKIVVLEQVNSSPEQELVQDLLNITCVFAARINGKRKYKKEQSAQQGKGKEILEIKDISEPTTEGIGRTVDGSV